MLVNHWLTGFYETINNSHLSTSVCFHTSTPQTDSISTGSFLTRSSESIFPREEDLSSSIPVLWHPKSNYLLLSPPPGYNHVYHGGSSPWSSVLLKPVPSQKQGSALCPEEMELLSYDADLQKGVFVTTPSSQLGICVNQNQGTHGLLTTWTLLWF